MENKLLCCVSTRAMDVTPLSMSGQHGDLYKEDHLDNMSVLPLFEVVRIATR